MAVDETADIRSIAGLSWTAARTRARCEKVVNEYCKRFGISSYLPLRRRAKRYQRRTVETFLPMFPGYVFVQINATNTPTLLQSHKVVTTLSIDSACEATLVAELREIQRLEQAELESDLIVHPGLAVGNSVLIVSGPLAGMHGVVERRQQMMRVTLNVEMLGQSVSVGLDVGEVDTQTD